MDKYDFFRKRLDKRIASDRKRQLLSCVPLGKGRIKKGNDIFLNLSSNDYLGLSFNQYILEKGYEYARKYGNGTGASRLVTGSPDFYFQVEKKIADLKHREKALLVSSGYQANITLIPALATRKSIIFSDSLNHNSIIRGAVLSRAEFKRFRHNDISHLEELLKKSMEKKYSSKIIITESVFSMDGDFGNINAISELSRKYGCIFVVDEAHATGVFGENGMGLASGADNADIIVGTFGKGGGVFGAYIASNSLLYEYLINFCEGVIFSTSFTPFNAGAVFASLELIPKMDKERKNLLYLSSKLREGLNKAGFNTFGSESQIIPVECGSDKNAVEMSRFLHDKKIIGAAIRPPSVPENMARVRLSLSAVHTEENIDYVLRVFDEWRKKQV